MEEKDLILFAMDQHLSDINKRTTPFEFLNLQRLVDRPTELVKIQALIAKLEEELSKYGYHLWMSNEYIEDTEN